MNPDMNIFVNEFVTHFIKSEEQMVDLEHHSKHPLLSELDPEKHGSGLSGQESKRKNAFPENFVPRSYWYSAGTAPESGLGPFKYKTAIPKKQVYDMPSDPDKLFPPEGMPFAYRLNQYEKNIRDAGYRAAYVGRQSFGGHNDPGPTKGHVYITFGKEPVKHKLL